jgi:pyridoxamine 5'-phosphate oxidase
MFFAELRREYSLTGLRRSDLDPDPLAQFQKWFAQSTGARRSGRIRKLLIRLYKSILTIAGSGPMEINAATLATTGNDGQPSARIVLLKGIDERGFIFFTNYDSRKGRELAENPRAALVFYWADQERQVCIAGEVTKVPSAESQAYFKTRPKGSRVGAWVSHQSELVENRGVLEERWRAMNLKYSSEEIPMPPYWGGYVLSPQRVEFWQGRPNRLHDRFRYLKHPDKWQIDRLSP